MPSPMKSPSGRSSRAGSRPNGGFTNLIVAFVVFWVVVYGAVSWYFMTSSANDAMPSSSQQRLQTNSVSASASAAMSHPAAPLPSGIDIHSNPFLSPSCKLTNHALPAPPPRSVSVIIPVRNEKKSVLLRTIESILHNSGAGADSALLKIVLVDDASTVPISEWAEIRSKSSNVAVVRSAKCVGLAAARNMGAKEVLHAQGGGNKDWFSGASTPESPQVLVFLTSHSVVSPDWLTPLYNTLFPRAGIDFVKTRGSSTADSKGENIVVFPTLDVWDGQTGDLIPADDNLVAGFTWGLGFRWENVYDDGVAGGQRTRSKRVVPSSTGDAGDAAKSMASYSPATPGIVAITARFFEEMGGFDGSLDTAGDVPIPATASERGSMDMLAKKTAEKLPLGGGKHTFYWSHDDAADPTMVEFSLRVWLCGGTGAAIVHQPCSRVANRYTSLDENGAVVGGGGGNDSVAGAGTGAHLQDGVTQRAVDHAIMRIAEYWFYPIAHRDVIYQARFLNRMPYTLTDISPHLRSPSHKFNIPTLMREQCMTMDWYLNEVYPGLLQEADVVRYNFQKYIDQSGFVEAAQAPLLQQYHKETSLGSMNSGEVDKMRQYAALDRKSKHHGIVIGAEGIERAASLEGSASNNALTVEEQKKIAEDTHENHIVTVRESQLCEDQPRTWEWDDCTTKAKSGLCSGGAMGYMMFGCPKSCGFCDIDKPTELCTDFYLMKCPLWAREGQCESNRAELEVTCRVSCGFCKQKAGGKSHLPDAAAVVAPVAPAAPVADVQDAAAKHLALVNKLAGGGGGGTERADPYVAQRQYHDNLLPDPLKDSSQNARCEMRGRPNGDLLDHVHIAPYDPTNPSNPKIFCGIYTMQSKHKDNVQATRETWAKKCTGFMAFSTASDPTIPAYQIHHEGEESYNNMWQKSKSIWMYIAEHYLDEFDFFVMGGDDMFYIMENLYAYLGSSTVQGLVKESEFGVYLGRRFTPPKQKTFNSGGAGYVLDKKALALLRDNIDTQRCFNHQVGFWEDVNVAHCLTVASGEKLAPFDTRDEQGRERFHPFTPGQHLTYGVPQLPKDDWYVKYNPQGLKTGPDCCSTESVSFHYVGADLMRKLHAYMYNCPLKKNL